MTRLEAAKARLEKAVARLEAACQSSGKDDDMAAELESMRAAYAALQQRSSDVSSRLDRAIGTLRGLTEG